MGAAGGPRGHRVVESLQGGLPARARFPRRRHPSFRVHRASSGCRFPARALLLNQSRALPLMSSTPTRQRRALGWRALGWSAQCLFGALRAPTHDATALFMPQCRRCVDNVLPWTYMKWVGGRPREWLGGTGLAAGFFLPIAAAREIDDALLMWTWRHSAELFAAWMVLALLATAALGRTLRVQRARLQAAIVLALGVLPALSLVAVTGRTLRETYGSTVMPPWAPVAGTLVLVLLVISGLWFVPGLVTRGLRRVYACTAVLIVPLFSFGLTAAHDVFG